MSSKNVTAESFYIKPIAAWVPDKLFPSHVPVCPRCETSRFVDVGKARWINNPKVLFGMDTHRYLDTKLYPCGCCNKRFTGYNRDSMKYSSNLYKGFFNFYLSGRFSVDDKLYAFITSCYDMHTPTIHRILEQACTEKYLNDYMYYLHAARAKRVKAQPPNVVEGNRSRSLDPVLTNLTNNPATPAERTLHSLQSQLKRKRLDLLSAENKVRDSICFKYLKKRKDGRNNNGSCVQNLVRPAIIPYWMLFYC